MNKEIEEIHEIIAQKCGTFDNPPHCYECKYVKVEYPFPYCKQWLNAEALYKAGYKKQIWHKIADNDFPPANTDVICFEKLKGTGQKAYDLCVYSHVEKCWYGFGFRADEIDEVIAWTELPLYESLGVKKNIQ